MTKDEIREALERANVGLAVVPIKNKPYVTVNERLKAFRREFPDGVIYTDIIDHGNDYNFAVVKASIVIDGEQLATGIAHEEKTFSAINKTSLVENAETSAVGRALGMLGIGIEDSIGSADEVSDAIQRQEKAETNREKVANFCRKHNISMVEVADRFGLDRRTNDAVFINVLHTLMDEHTPKL